MESITSFLKGPLKNRNDLHLLRRLWHIGMGLFALGMFFKFPNLGKTNYALVAVLVGSFAISVDVLRLKNQKINKFIVKIFRPIMRMSEINNPTGVPYFAFGVAVSLYFFNQDVAILSILFLIFSDPIASFVGVRFGKDQIIENKSLQGTLACYISSYLLTLGYCYLSNVNTPDIIGFAMICALFGTLGEFLGSFVDDNFAIPVVSGIGITIANHYFQIF